MAPNLVSKSKYVELSVCDGALLHIREKNQDTVDAVSDTSLWNDNINGKEDNLVNVVVCLT